MSSEDTILIPEENQVKHTQILIDALEKIADTKVPVDKNPMLAQLAMIKGVARKAVKQYKEKQISVDSESGCNCFLSPVLKERENQIKRLKEIFPNYPNDCESWQYLNGLLLNFNKPKNNQ